jgi:hypothetical protein
LGGGDWKGGRERVRKHVGEGRGEGGGVMPPFSPPLGPYMLSVARGGGGRRRLDGKGESVRQHMERGGWEWEEGGGGGV